MFKPLVTPRTVFRRGPDGAVVHYRRSTAMMTPTEGWHTSVLDEVGRELEEGWNPGCQGTSVAVRGVELRSASCIISIRFSRARATLERIVPIGHPQIAAASA